MKPLLYVLALVALTTLHPVLMLFVVGSWLLAHSIGARLKRNRPARVYRSAPVSASPFIAPPNQATELERRFRLVVGGKP